MAAHATGTVSNNNYKHNNHIQSQHHKHSSLTSSSKKGLIRTFSLKANHNHAKITPPTECGNNAVGESSNYNPDTRKKSQSKIHAHENFAAASAVVNKFNNNDDQLSRFSNSNSNFTSTSATNTNNTSYPLAFKNSIYNPPLLTPAVSTSNSSSVCSSPTTSVLSIINAYADIAPQSHSDSQPSTQSPNSSLCNLHYRRSHSQHFFDTQDNNNNDYSTTFNSSPLKLQENYSFLDINTSTASLASPKYHNLAPTLEFLDNNSNTGKQQLSSNSRYQSPSGFSFNSGYSSVESTPDLVSSSTFSTPRKNTKKMSSSSGKKKPGFFRRLFGVKDSNSNSNSNTSNISNTSESDARATPRSIETNVKSSEIGTGTTAVSDTNTTTNTNRDDSPKENSKVKDTSTTMESPIPVSIRKKKKKNITNKL